MSSGHFSCVSHHLGAILTLDPYNPSIWEVKTMVILYSIQSSRPAVLFWGCAPIRHGLRLIKFNSKIVCQLLWIQPLCLQRGAKEKSLSGQETLKSHWQQKWGNNCFIGSAALPSVKGCCLPSAGAEQLKDLYLCLDSLFSGLLLEGKLHFLVIGPLLQAVFAYI